MMYEFRLLVDAEELPAGSVIEVEMKVAEYDDFIAENSDILERYIGEAPAVRFDGKTFFRDVQSRQPDGFKEVLAKIGEQHTNSAVAERYTRKSIKQVRNEQLLKKHDKVNKAKAAEARR